MALTLFPVFPTDVKMINSKIGVKIIGETVFYFNEGGVFFQHDKNDYQSFRFITSQMIVLKIVRQVEVINFFEVSKESVIRWWRTYRDKGANGFFGTKKVSKRGNILTPEVITEIQGKLNLGESVKSIGEGIGIKPDTIQKAIQAGRLTKPAIENLPTSPAKTQSQRSVEDSAAVLGVGCTNEEGRMDAAQKKK